MTLIQKHGGEGEGQHDWLWESRRPWWSTHLGASGWVTGCHLGVYAGFCPLFPGTVPLCSTTSFCQGVPALNPAGHGLNPQLELYSFMLWVPGIVPQMSSIKIKTYLFHTDKCKSSIMPVTTFPLLVQDRKPALILRGFCRYLLCFISGITFHQTVCHLL